MNAPLNMMDVIRKAATSDKTCPFCGEFPGLASRIAGRHVVGCENDHCDVRPQVSSPVLAEAWMMWNTRRG